MTEIPSCTSMGAHCHALPLTLRVADLGEDDARFRDDVGTWLMGHTENIDFGTPRIDGDWVVVDATIHAPCRYLNTGRGARCTAHGFSGVLPEIVRAKRPSLVRGGGSVVVMQDERVQTLTLRARPKPLHSLPTLQANPCVGAPCRTADNTMGAACCRDLTLDVVLPADDFEAEALLASRQAPYIGKVGRLDESIMECEAISACGYLAADRVTCSLHDLVRADGSPAKPSICSEWPDLNDDAGSWHPGCRLVEKASPATTGVPA